MVEEKNSSTVTARISCSLNEYVKHIQKRFREEYGINVQFTEACNLLVGRAHDNKIF